MNCTFALLQIELTPKSQKAKSKAIEKIAKIATIATIAKIAIVPFCPANSVKKGWSLLVG